jgi:hypothetical protein
MESKVELNADTIQAMSVFTFPFIYWQDIDQNIISFSATYTEFLTALYGANKFKSIFVKKGKKIFNTNAIEVDQGFFSITKASAGKGEGGDGKYKGDNRKEHEKDDGSKNKIEVDAVSVDNLIKPIMLQINVGSLKENFIMTIQALSNKLKFDFTDTLIRDVNISGPGILNYLSRNIISFIRKGMNISINQVLKGYPQVFDKSIGTELFSRSSFGKTLPDIMRTAYCLIDISQLPSEYRDKVFDRDTLVNLTKLGWAGFIFYIPEKSRLIFITRRMTYEHISGGITSAVSSLDFDVRFVNLSMLKAFNTLADKTQFFTKDQLDKIMSEVPTLGLVKGLSIAKGLVSK